MYVSLAPLTPSQLFSPKTERARSSLHKAGHTVQGPKSTKGSGESEMSNGIMAISTHAKRCFSREEGRHMLIMRKKRYFVVTGRRRRKRKSGGKVGLQEESFIVFPESLSSFRLVSPSNRQLANNTKKERSALTSFVISSSPFTLLLFRKGEVQAR